MRSARINGSRLIRDLCLVSVLVVIAIAQTLAQVGENLALAQCRFASYVSRKQAAISFIRVILRVI